MFYLAHEHEGAAGGDFVGEVAQVLEACILVVQYGRLEVDHHIGGEFFVGQYYDFRACLGVGDFDFVAYDKEFFVGFLLLKSGLGYGVGVYCGAAVQNWHFGAIHTDEHVVYSGGVECGHSMFYCADGDVGGDADDGAAAGGYDVFGYGGDDGLTFEVDTLDFVSGTFGGGVECCRDIEACMQPFALERKGLGERELFHCGVYGVMCCFVPVITVAWRFSRGRRRGQRVGPGGVCTLLGGQIRRRVRQGIP